MTKHVNDRSVEYLMVVPDAFRDAIEPLRAFREPTFHTAILSTASLSSYEPALRPRVLQDMIREFYAHSMRGGFARLKYVLLVGDDVEPFDPHSIPVGRYPALPNMGVESALASDAFYGDMDDADPLPEIAVGRLPVNSAVQARDLVQRILAYEKERVVAGPASLAFYAGEAGFGWLQDTLLAATFYESSEQYFPRSFPLQIFAEDKTSVFYSDTSFAEVLNSGHYDVVTFFGHGNTTSLGTRDGFGIQDLSTLTSHAHRAIVSLMACSTGCVAGAECFGKSLLRAAAGPVAVLASSVSTPDRVTVTGTSPYALDSFGDGVASHLQDVTTLGEVFLSAQYHVTNRHDVMQQLIAMAAPQFHEYLALWPNLPDGLERQALGMMLFGDPAMTWNLRGTAQASRATTSSIPDARVRMPRVERPMAERIHGQPLTRPSANGPLPDLLDTRDLTPAESGLERFDFLAYRVWESLALWFLNDTEEMKINPPVEWSTIMERLAANFVARELADILPRPGDTTLTAGIYRIPLYNGGLALGLTQLPRDAVLALVPGGYAFHGYVDLGDHVQFGARFSRAGRLTIYGIDGITLQTTNGGAPNVLREVAIDFSGESPCISAAYCAVPDGIPARSVPIDCPAAMHSARYCFPPADDNTPPAVVSGDAAWVALATNFQQMFQTTGH